MPWMGALPSLGALALTRSRLLTGITLAYLLGAGALLAVLVLGPSAQWRGTFLGAAHRKLVALLADSSEGNRLLAAATDMVGALLGGFGCVCVCGSGTKTVGWCAHPSRQARAA